MKFRSSPLIGLLVLLSGCAHSQTTALSPPVTSTAPRPLQAGEDKSKARATQLDWSVLQTFPHDTGAFTEGLLWRDGSLYESTGLEGKSSVRRVDLSTGQVLQKYDFAANLFGEGLAWADGKFYFLTWQNKLGFVLSPTDLAPQKRFTYNNEGWGLTSDGHQLIQSDGTSALTFRDPKNFAPIRVLRVTWDGQPLERINELEWIDGLIWANVWQTDDVVIIDPVSGKVRSYLDLSSLLPATQRTAGEDVLNGIAYDAADKRIFVTGKNWPKLYWIRVGDPAH